MLAATVSAGNASPVKTTWQEVTADNPCPVCWRGGDGCRVSDRSIACVWQHTHLGERKQASDGTVYTLYKRDTFRHVPPIDAAVDLLLKHFFSRTDVVAFDPRPEWKQTACPASGNEALPHLVRAHLGGPKVRVPWQTSEKEGSMRQSRNWRIGSYGPAPDGTTRWVVADFDGGSDHADPLAEPTAEAVIAYRRFWRAGIACYLERSRSCSGWHLWVFFSSPISAAKARALARRLLQQEVLTIDGEIAEIEIFPKRDSLHGARVGNQVWLPWYCRAARSGNLFYRPADGRLIPFIPEMLEVVHESTVDAVLAQEGGA